MNCLIIAAGHGSRLREISPSKPLTPVAGVPLIEHVIAPRRGGRRDARSPSSPAMRPSGVEAFLADLHRALGVPIETVRARRTGTGPTAIRCWPAPQRSTGDYLLSMSDHLFDPAIVRGC